MTPHRQQIRVGAAVAAGVLVLAACGSDAESVDDSADDAADASSGVVMDDSAEGDVMSMDDDGAMDHSTMEMNMGDASATPADSVVGAALARGEYVLMETRPAGYDEVEGTAVIARHEGGTTVTTELTGLLPGVEYISHLHAQACDDEAGGPHYQFEIGGSEMPPNEIHLAFTSDADGRGFMTAENDRIAGLDAVAFVVHPAEFIDNKVACVDFAEDEPGAAEAALAAGLDPSIAADAMDEMDHDDMDMDAAGDDATGHADHDDGDHATEESGDAVGLVSVSDIDVDSLHAMDDELYDGVMKVDEHLAVVDAAMTLLVDAGAEVEQAELLGYLTELRAALEAGDVEAASAAAQWAHKIAHDLGHHG